MIRAKAEVLTAQFLRNGKVQLQCEMTEVIDGAKIGHIQFSMSVPMARVLLGDREIAVGEHFHVDLIKR